LENQTEEEILAAKQANALILSKVFLKIWNVGERGIKLEVKDNVLPCEIT
jgi:hypothetical protein